MALPRRSPGAPGPAAAAKGTSHGFAVLKQPLVLMQGALVLQLCLQLEFPLPKAAGEFRPAFSCLSSDFLWLCCTSARLA